MSTPGKRKKTLQTKTDTSTKKSKTKCGMYFNLLIPFVS